MSRPVDLNIGNSIIAAFAQGRAEALERLRNKQVQDQLAIENERVLQKQKVDEQQFQQQLKQQQLEFEARQKMDELGYQLQKTGTKINIEEVLRKQIREGGTPSGYDKEELAPALNEQVRQMPTIFGEPAYEQEILRFRRQAGQDELLPETITERNPVAARREETMLRRAELDAALGRQQEMARFQSNLPGVVKADTIAGHQFDLEKEAVRQKNEIELAKLEAALGKYRSSAAGSQKMQAAGAIADLFESNPDLFYAPGVGTPSEKLLGAALLKQKTGRDILAEANKTASTTAANALKMIAEIEKGVKDGTFQTGAVAKAASKVGADIVGRKDFSNSRKLQLVINNLLAPQLQLYANLKPFSEADRNLVRDASTILDMGLDKGEFLELLKEYKRILPELQKPVLSSGPGATPNPADFDEDK